MSEFKGTKGPWFMEYTQNGWHRIQGSTTDDKDIIRADRKLIASAPELLEALEDMVDNYWTGGGNLDKAKSAISKALGIKA